MLVNDVSRNLNSFRGMLPGVTGSFLAGLALQASLIAAIGPQNAFVLRQGLRREHVWAVVGLCVAADALLVGAAAAGLSAAVGNHRPALALVTWAGVAAMAGYGVRALLRALRPGELVLGGGQPLTRRAALGQAAAFTFLNPHVYVDAVLGVGMVATAQAGRGTTWFALGACSASALWFAGIGLSAQLLAPLLARPITWRGLDLATGIAMCGLAARMAMGG